MWTTTELESEFRSYEDLVWRVVEAQHRISTSRLAGSIEDQKRLEELADEAKPKLPVSARGLHYLLASPFRYGHAVSSRFRKAKEWPGIFYASETEAGAIAETAYWRLRFISRSPGFVLGNRTSEHLSFSARLKLERLLDLTRKPFDEWHGRWTDPNDYSSCQDFAGVARQSSAQALRTESARAAETVNLVLLDPQGFADNEPTYGRTWHLRYENDHLTAYAAAPGTQVLRFTPGTFGLDFPLT
ncbi:RES family NAD+ phosphorylase [Pacificimonas flava]|uniref:RES family NAD+ phosphorylase n=1 Tax=Pacificimonas flava TaxID=1234595 RepID=UPI000571964C|nr:RES family NAD+ phosphorylase [Pacificimonas flava]MBB5281848.1 hypothetical protein [Pacificimonas flava]